MGPAYPCPAASQLASDDTCAPAPYKPDSGRASTTTTQRNEGNVNPNCSIERHCASDETTSREASQSDCDVGNACGVVDGVQRLGHQAKRKCSLVQTHGMDAVRQQDGNAGVGRKLHGRKRAALLGHALSRLGPGQADPAPCSRIKRTISPGLRALRGTKSKQYGKRAQVR